jgi:hypothetical protein
MAAVGGASADGSLAGFASLDAMLEQHLPATQLAEARRVLYGAAARGAARAGIASRRVSVSFCAALR